ncbi:glycosyltransferase family 2 protein [Comamonas koreensis]|uniref:Glycosyltransferase family 2 protein n=1 Tax=Comamonas koreensis TaxID=160825 RepID=A0AAW4Y3G5_9BURK|nr:glycosyltransferase family 2 protein [Comamonas koreensis]MCD2167616.1 glycosyltransferase family 2 protein [Comamonas koreensis]
MELTILMPCLNEALTVEKCVRSALDFIQRSGIDGEVLIADNGSSDGSKMLANRAGARVVDICERGYGAALLGGIKSARGKYIIMGDADDSYDFSNLQGFVAELRAGAQLVMGNRFKGGIEPGAMPFLHRWLGNPVLSALGRLFFRLPVGDFHCGLRGFETKAIREIHLTGTGMEFATEMVAKAAMAGLRVVEVATTLKPDGRDRPPHLRTWRDGWRHLRFMLLFSPLWLFLLPGGLLLMLSVVGLLALWQGPVRLGPLGLDVHTMMFCSIGTMLGFLAIQWGSMIQWLGAKSGMRPQPSNQLVKMVSRFCSIETGLFAGLALFLPGLWWALVLTNTWAQQGFGTIFEADVLRNVILAGTLMVIGAQTIGGSLFAGALRAVIDSGFMRLRAGN